MKCEMCGGTDFVKDNGLYTCQSCFSKYTVEEARKLFADVADTSVNVESQAQEENLLVLARTSMNSKNYEDVEKTCNQILAMNAKNYEAWVLKASAISWMSDSETMRLSESFNCLINAYSCLAVKDEEKKKELKNEFANLYLSEINFRIENYAKEISGDTTEMLIKAIDVYVSNGFETLVGIGCEEEAASIEQKIVINDIIKSGKNYIEALWERTAKKYYRNDYYNYGKNWGTFDEVRRYSERPNKEDFNDFALSTSNLIVYGNYLAGICNDLTNKQMLIDMLRRLNQIEELLKNSCSFEVDGGDDDGYFASYGIATKPHWIIHYTLTKEAIEKRSNNIAQRKSLIDLLEKEEKEKAEAERLAKEEMQRASNEKYWNEHKELREELLSKKEKAVQIVDNLNNELKSIDSQIETIKAKEFAFNKADAITKSAKELADLEEQIKHLGIFKFKEKKELNNRIDQCRSELDELYKAYDEEQALFEKQKQSEIEPLKVQKNQIAESIKKQDKIIKEADSELNRNY